MANTTILWTLAQVDDFQDFEGPSSNGALAAGFMVFFLIGIAVTVVALVGMWKVFQKAGQPGWAAIVPIYNVYVLDEIAGRPAWWLVLWLIPLVNIVPALVVPIDVAHRFGKGTGFGLGLVFLSPIFYPILGFGDARYLPGETPAA